MIFPALQDALNNARQQIDAAHDQFQQAPKQPLDEAFRLLLGAVDELHAAVQTLYETAQPEEEPR